MRTLSLRVPEGYDHDSSPVIASTVSQLDALLSSLTARVNAATPEDLEWQPLPSVNTMGMLMAHLAITEVYWVEVVGRDLDSEGNVDQVTLDLVGLRVDDDGTPTAAPS